METKNNPTPGSCLAKALPDEPMFILLARDRCAPDTIRFWADQRSQLGVEQGESQDAEQLLEALETAEEMGAWRARNDGGWRNHHRDADVVPTPRDELSSIAGRIMSRGPAMGLARAAMPEGQEGMFVSTEAFNSLLADAKKLAGFVLNADPVAGPNHG